MNATDETRTNTNASRRVIAPRGISRIAVRGFFASYCASTRRLKPIAALRAATIATTIQATRHPISPAGSLSTEAESAEVECSASKAPVSANGSAKTLWLKRTNDR